MDQWIWDACVGKDEKGRGRVVTSNSVSAMDIFTGVWTIGQT